MRNAKELAETEKKIQDYIAKGIMTEDKVRHALTLRAAGWSGRRIAAEMGIEAVLIYAVLRGKRWAHVSASFDTEGCGHNE